MTEGQRRPPRKAQADVPLTSYSPTLFRFFGFIFAQALKRDFRAVRLSRAGPPPSPPMPHMILYSNHPSWWDAAIYVWLATTLFKGRRLFAPMEAAMVQRYRFMRRIGAFGIERGTREGSALFLAAAGSVLDDPSNILLITAQGTFVDSRVRPLRLAPGIIHLARAHPAAIFVPLALDYAFWDERRPEVFMRFGAAVPASTLSGLDRGAISDRLSHALTDAMDGLAAEVMGREPKAFDILLAGRVGVGGVYDLWRRARATATGDTFQAAHRSEP